MQTAERIDRVRFGDILKNTAELFRPPRRISVAEAAEKYVRISTPGSYSGPWSAAQTPYMIEPMNLTASRRHEALIFAGPARTGKTQALVDATIGYQIMCDPGDTLVVHMTEEAARKYSRMRVSRMLRNSPDLREKMSPVRHDDNILGKYFKNGTALILGWPSPTQLSAQDYRYVFLTDYDRMPDDTGEGDVFGLGMKRTQTFMSGGMCVVESSPGKDYTDTQWRPATPHEAPPVGGVLGIYNLGDRRQWYWPCPACSEEFACKPGLDLFVMPRGKELHAILREADPIKLAREYAVIACPHCGSLIEHRQKTEINSCGRWVSDGTESNIASFWLGGVAAKFQSWEQMLQKELQALKHWLTTGEEEKLKSTRNLDQGLPHIPMAAAKRRNASDLELRCEHWTKGVVPMGVRFLVATVDVQGNRFVVQVHGIGVDNEIWLVDRHNIQYSKRGRNEPIDPAGYPEDWDVLIEHTILKTYPLDDGSGRRMPVQAVGCDSGGKAGVTGKAYDFWRRLKSRGLHRKFFLLKGDAKYTGPRVRESFPDATGREKGIARGDVPVQILNTLLLKDDTDGALKREAPGAGYVHFPAWLGPWFYEELSAEVRTDKGWENPDRKRNEAWDLLTYCRAMLIKLGCDRIGWWQRPRTWALDWDHNPELISGESADEAPQPEEKKPRPSPRAPRMRMRR